LLKGLSDLSDPAGQFAWYNYRVESLHYGADLNRYVVVCDRYFYVQTVQNISDRDINERQHMAGRQLKSSLQFHCLKAESLFFQHHCPILHFYRLMVYIAENSQWTRCRISHDLVYPTDALN
jgi:hypothetical protein